MLNVEIISIEGLIFQGEVSQIVVPTISGEVGFMKGHESLICEIKEGIIIIFGENDNKIKEIQVKNGTVEMHNGEKLTILLDF